MKLTPTPIQVDELEGFSPDKDIFQRKSFGEQLHNLLANIDDELVIALDAPWGEGKTTFVQMWRGLLANEGVKSIYFDAYRNDFIEDPFLALVGEIHALLKEDESDGIKEAFKDKAISALKVFGRAGVRIGLKAATAGLVDDSALEDAGAGEELAGVAEKLISDRLEDIENDKKTIEGFRETLAEVADHLGNGKKLVFIIDELDRCKPSFALSLLEKVKHVLSVQGVVFLLVLNREQIEEVIKSNYGAGIDSSSYLQKFVHIWASLPKSTEQHSSDIKKYLRNCLERMDFKIENRNHQTFIEIYEDLAEYYNMSLREIERSLSNYAIIHNITGGNLNSDYMYLAVYLSIVKARYPSAYSRLRNGKLTYEEALTETELHRLEVGFWEGKPEGHPLKWLIKYYVSSDSEVESLLEQGNYSSVRGYRLSAIQDISGWLESFTK